MSWNGSGTFNRIFSWVADKNAGLNISSSRMDTDTNDIASNGFGNCLTRDGQGQASANLPMATFRHTGVGAAVNRTDYARLDQVQDGISLNWTTAGGTADALTAAYTPSLTALVDGQLCFVRAANANATTTPTFAPNGLTAHTITKAGGGALVVGDIAGNLSELILRYNLANTRWELLNPNTFTIASNQVVTASITNKAVTYAKIQDVAAGKFLGGNLTGAANAAPTENIVPFGQCRLSKSGSNLLLLPFKGNLLTLNSIAVQIPDAGITLSTGGLSASTLYYIYAFMNSGTMTLEAVVTAYATQAGTGVTIKTGDVTRTLVGMASTDGSVAWADSATQRFVRSWFNDPGIGLLNAFTANRTTVSLTYIEINTEIRINFLVWTGEPIQIEASGPVAGGGTGATNTSIAIDGTTPEDTYAQTVSTNNQVFSVGLVKTGLTEGSHFATLVGNNNNSGGTSTWTGGAAGARTTLRGFAKF